MKMWYPLGILFLAACFVWASAWWFGPEEDTPVIHGMEGISFEGITMDHEEAFIIDSATVDRTLTLPEGGDFPPSGEITEITTPEGKRYRLNDTTRKWELWVPTEIKIEY